MMHEQEQNQDMFSTVKEQLTPEKLRSIIESLLFVHDRPIKVPELMKILSVEKPEIDAAIEQLKNHYEQINAGVCIVNVAGGIQMCSCPENDEWVKRLYHEKKKQRLSMPALETLAIIAYKQPITRLEIEIIRGVNVDGVVRNLFEIGLIKTAGKKEVVGRPFLYATSKKFLEYFGLNSLNDLPKLEEFVNFAEQQGISDDQIYSDSDTESNGE